MQIKGWSIINKTTEEIKLTLITEPEKAVYKNDERGTERSAYEGRIEIGSYGCYTQYSFDTKLFEVKPCVIIINDKAVGK